ncbi:AmmeMemoRadiSam system protein B [Desulfosoma caldarium]|uniref:MEMO1 family protein EDC27_0786 n=1 Tax=Desulfosoma caldarium TaxID=610254 RepID=A0A3N1VNW4_9BACT|nr:AmmeMemoRadiSam system protein B [Desulfosoma caldarium]ROR01607.1 hypothetical protein EDC27_0786 [Desulfosoma caldarium]
MGSERIRESVIAGTWYPGNPEKLRTVILEYLAKASAASLSGRLVGLVAPHAGYMYSGPVAAYAYKLLEGRPVKKVLIMAPSHRAYFNGASVDDVAGYRTPLGVVSVDRVFTKRLMAYQDLFSHVPQAHAQEHSLEIQLPFLQVVLGAFQMIPVLIGDVDLDGCRRLAQAVAKAIGDDEVLLVASTDLSHYYTYQDAKKLDARVIEKVDGYDPEGLFEALRRRECEACGGGPLVTTLLAARELGATKARVLHYANSGDVTGDVRGVVGYMAAAIVDNPGKAVKEAPSSEPPESSVEEGLSEQEKSVLRTVAWQAIRWKLGLEAEPVYEGTASKLWEKRGAFVTLRKQGALRGCIGYVEPHMPLWRTVKEAAVQAAFADPRFPPVRAAEVDALQLEISALSPLERLKDPLQFTVGRHGLVIRKGYHNGLLLPQVAVEHAWGKEEFLNWTCKKAGLSPECWRDGNVEVYRFGAEVF